MRTHSTRRRLLLAKCMAAGRSMRRLHSYRCWRSWCDHVDRLQKAELAVLHAKLQLRRRKLEPALRMMFEGTVVARAKEEEAELRSELESAMRSLREVESLKAAAQAGFTEQEHALRAELEATRSRSKELKATHEADTQRLAAAHSIEAVSYTHLTLPTNREV